MKTRTKFVSNSSSSSFIINKNYLSEEQIKDIVNHIEVAKSYRPTKQSKYDLKYVDTYDAWNIGEDHDSIQGFTIMDNFNMEQFLESIGVDDKNVQWGESYNDLDKHEE